MKHYAFLVDGSADSSVKSFLEGNKGLEEFQKVMLTEGYVNIAIVLTIGDQLLSTSGC